MDYGIWTLLPIVVVVAVALKSRRALEPLILGTLLTYIIVDGLSFPIGWMDAFFRVATDQSHQWVFMVCGLFGALIALLGASHGTLGFSRLLGRLCRGPRTTLIVTWVMGILIFVDDYLNIMTLSTCMRKLTDRQKVPRETLSYIIDSTGAPVCALLPFSTWAVFFAGLFYAEAGIPELGYGSAINTFCAVIPFIFYAIAAVALVPCSPWGWCPSWGDEEGLPPGGGDRKGLLAGERRAESGGRGRLPGHYRLPVGLCAPHRHADRLDYRGGRAVPGPGGRHRRVLFALHPPEEAVSH
ncbi:MAG: hypothetical protein ACLRIS_13690 [Flavonifractor plautii]